ncbi:MAG: hypothetical protein GXO90_05565 [FCB group bacterium]|nr:hypothetical protein [FCB group bacterium]
MANDIKSGIGYIIPATAILGFVLSLFAEQFIWAVLFAAAGILVWFLYMMVMESKLPEITGNIVILFAVLLALGVFFAFGWETDMFGGITIRPEGSLIAVLVLLFGVLSGVLFNRDRNRTGEQKLSPEEKEWVQQALDQTASDSSKEPRVVIVKQEPAKEKETPPPVQSYPPYMMPYQEYDEDDDDDEDEYEDEDWDEYDDDDEDE